MSLSLSLCVVSKRLTNFVVLFGFIFILSGCDNKDNTAEDNVTNVTIQGRVIDGVVIGADVNVYLPNNTRILGTAKTDTNGDYKIELAEALPDFYRVIATGGSTESGVFDGRIEADCFKAECNLTPLTTLSSKYKALLITGSDLEKVNNTKQALIQSLGVTDADFSAIELSNESHFKWAEFHRVATERGFNNVIDALVNDLADGILDDVENQSFFPAVKLRTAEPINVETAPVVTQETGEAINLNVSSIDGSQETRGHVTEIVATTTTTVINDDLEEVESEVVIYYGFNVGEWAGQLNVETTILAELFSSDIGLALLPNEGKINLIQLLKTEHTNNYQQVLSDYSRLIETNALYAPIYENSLNILLGNAQDLLQKNISAETVIEQRASLQRSIQTRAAKETYQASSFVDVSYNTEEYSFKVTNGLPVYFGLKLEGEEQTTKDALTNTLVNPSASGAAGLALSGLDSTSLNWLLDNVGLKHDKSTTITGDIWDERLFPTSGSLPIDGIYSFELYKSLGLNLPTVMNTSQGATYVISALAGSSLGGKFNEVMKITSSKLEGINKALKYSADAAEVIEGIGEFTYLLIDIAINELYPNKADVPENLFTYRNIVKELYKDTQAVNLLIKGIQSLASVSYNENTETETDEVTKKKTEKFLTKMGGSKGVVIYEKMMIPTILADTRILDEKTNKMRITKKQAFSIISIGAFMGNVFSAMKPPELATKPIGYPSIEAYKEELDGFKKTYGISVSSYAYIFAYEIITKNKSNANILYKQFSAGDLRKTKAARIAFLKLESVAAINSGSKGGVKLILKAAMKTIYSDIQIFKIINDAKRLSGNDLLKGGVKVITALLKQAESSAVRQIQGIATNILKQIPSYLFGTKGLQLAAAANDLVGLGYAWGATPSIIPLGIEVQNSQLKFLEPEIKVLAVTNELKRVEGQEDAILTFQNTRHPLVVASTSSPSAYSLSYKVYFENKRDQLIDFIYKDNTFTHGAPIAATLGIKKFPDDNLNIEAEAFGSSNNSATWFVTAKEVRDNLQENNVNPKIGAELDLADVLTSQNTEFLQWSIFGDSSSTAVSNKTRGIFLESFNYILKEADNSALAGKNTVVESQDRMVFKALSATDLRKGIILSRTNNQLNAPFAVTNKTGFVITIYDETNYFEWELRDGQTKVFSYIDYKDLELTIFDHVVAKYGQEHGFLTVYDTLLNLAKTQPGNQGSSLNTLFNKYSVSASAPTSSETLYPFLLTIKASDYTDVKVAIENMIPFDDVLDMFDDATAVTILNSQSNDLIFPIAQYAASQSSSEFNQQFALQSGALIATTLPADSAEYNLTDNYKLKDLTGYKAITDTNTYGIIKSITLTNAAGDTVKFSIASYQNAVDGETLTLILDGGASNLLECVTSNCISNIENLQFQFVISNNKALYPDADADGIVDVVDQFPDSLGYEDTDRDGMPDSWELSYGLNPNDSLDAEKDNDNDIITNKQEYLDGTSPIDPVVTVVSPLNPVINILTTFTITGKYLPETATAQIQGADCPAEYKKRISDTELQIQCQQTTIGAATLTTVTKSGGDLIHKGTETITFREFPIVTGFDYPIGDRGYTTENKYQILLEQIAEEKNIYTTGIGTITDNHSRESKADGAKWRNASDVGNYLDTSLTGGLHPGEDWNLGSFDSDAGQAVYAIAEGQVDRIQSTFSSYGVGGWTLILKHKLSNGDFIYSHYLHVTSASEVSGTLVSSDKGFTVKVGDIVPRGQLIARLAKGKASTGGMSAFYSHLHFEMQTKAIVGSDMLPEDNGNGYYTFDRSKMTKGLSVEGSTTGELTTGMTAAEITKTFTKMKDLGIIDPSDYIERNRISSHLLADTLITGVVYDTLVKGSTATFTVNGDNLPGSIAFELSGGSCGEAYEITATQAKVDCDIPDVEENSFLFNVGAYPGSDALKGAESLSVEVGVVDVIPPVITLNGSANISLTQGTAYTELGATANDAVDGAVTVIPTGTVNESTVGQYSITYTATDSAGNEATAERIVTIDMLSSMYSIVGSLNTEGRARSVAVSGNYAYLTSTPHFDSDLVGLEIINISDPTSPKIVGSLDTRGAATSVVLSGNYAYILEQRERSSSYTGYLRVVDISDSSAPKIVGSFPNSGSLVEFIRDPTAIEVIGGYAYVTDFSSGLHIIDISTPETPIQISALKMPDHARSIAIAEGYAYVATQSTGVQIINISNRSAPVILKGLDTIEPLGSVLYVTVSGDNLYVSGYKSGGEWQVKIFDISTPNNPTSVGLIVGAEDVFDIKINGNYAYLAVANFGVQVVDISTPSSPIIVGAVKTPNDARSIGLYGNYVYVTNLDSGLQIIKVTETPVSIGSSKLNDTGITWSGNYPSGNNATCVGTEVDKQDCSHGRDAQAAAGTLTKIGAGAAGFDFTKLDSNGNTMPASASSWSCVKDNHTGLIWEVKTTDGGIHDTNNNYRWGGLTAQGRDHVNREGTYYDDWNTLVDGSNNNNFCGFNTGWRVPNRHELRSIIRLGVPNLKIEMDYFPNALPYGLWSSSPNLGRFRYGAWYVDFNNGNTGYHSREAGAFVRLVRSGQ
mgnify:CR=1 FL=1